MGDKCFNVSDMPGYIWKYRGKRYIPAGSTEILLFKYDSYALAVTKDGKEYIAGYYGEASCESGDIIDETIDLNFQIFEERSDSFMGALEALAPKLLCFLAEQEELAKKEGVTKGPYTPILCHIPGQDNNNG